MQIRFLLGPAGSGKTFSCLAEARVALQGAPDGPPLLLLAPKQTTFELERRFLTDPAVRGYTRLHILSFDRLAHHVFDRLKTAAPALLNEQGRLMVLRSLLASKRDDLKLFRASSRLNGFANQLSLVLSELQRHNFTPETLRLLAGQVSETGGLSLKLQDLSLLLKEYLNWLTAHELEDSDCLLTAATQALEGKRSSKPASDVQVAGKANPLIVAEQLWVDGFGEFSPQELELLAALLPYCNRATITFCLDLAAAEKASWLSCWSAIRDSFDKCHKRLQSVPGAEIGIEVLSRNSKGRFEKTPALRHLEQFWAEPKPFVPSEQVSTSSLDESHKRKKDRHDPNQLAFSLFSSEPKNAPEVPISSSISLSRCADPEAEATFAAREILRHVRDGGRYREVSILVRRLEGYHEILQRVLAAYEIPYFLDRRESVAHHPLAELTRSALRTAAFKWQNEDWFAALKTGLVPAEESEIDELETHALAQGWKGAAWHNPLRVPAEIGLSPDRARELELRLEGIRQKIIPPFHHLGLTLATHGNRPTGPQLATALRDLWKALNAAEQLEQWTRGEPESDDATTSSVHATVWEQMNSWLENIELAFPREPLPMKEWLPILEAGLSSLTVGVIPPALDQVLIGTIDRSRNPEIKLAFIPGMNETVFPAAPENGTLLNEADRAELDRRSVSLGLTAQRHLGRERFYAYVACTRPSERLVLTYALNDSNGSPLNPSPFVSHIQQLFPSLKIETVSKALDLRESVHVSELIVPLLKSQLESDNEGTRSESDPLKRLSQLPVVAGVLEKLRNFQRPQPDQSLAPELAARLYGSILKTSVSRIENFAACPFKFFVHSGLRAEERRIFELDAKEQGNFQHDVLADFHDELRDEEKRWRDLTPSDARERVARIANGLLASYREGLLQSSEQSRFVAKVLTASLQNFVEILVQWMREQYRFDPVKVELPFDGHKFPAWEIPLRNNHRLQLQGRIDRVDLCAAKDKDKAWCVVVDYKSSYKQLDAVLIEHGIQLQLPAYLNVLRRWPDARGLFGFERLIPAGVFYVNLRGRYERGRNRTEALANARDARKRAYQHTGRFDKAALPYLDARPDVDAGDQFKYKLKEDGDVSRVSREALDSADFAALLDSVEANLARMGEQIFAGVAVVHPFRKAKTTACSQCDYLSICRFDAWTQSYRVLTPGPAPAPRSSSASSAKPLSHASR